jgi:hypothetical protein
LIWIAASISPQPARANDPASTLIQLIHNTPQTIQVLTELPVFGWGISLNDANPELRDSNVEAVQQALRQNGPAIQTLQAILAAMPAPCPSEDECFCPPGTNCPATVGDILNNANVPVSDVVTVSVAAGVVNIYYLLPTEIQFTQFSRNAIGTYIALLQGNSFTPFSLVDLHCSNPDNNWSESFHVGADGTFATWVEYGNILGHPSGQVTADDQGRPEAAIAGC